MSELTFGVWEDEMRKPNAGAFGGEKGNLDVKCSLKVPDGLWHVMAVADVDNNDPFAHMVELKLIGDKATDYRVVRLAKNGSADKATVSFLMLEHFPGTNENRVNDISLGIWNHHETGKDIPNIRIGRMRIIARRIPHWVMEPNFRGG